MKHLFITLMPLVAFSLFATEQNVSLPKSPFYILYAYQGEKSFEGEIIQLNIKYPKELNVFYYFVVNSKKEALNLINKYPNKYSSLGRCNLNAGNYYSYEIAFDGRKGYVIIDSMTPPVPIDSVTGGIKFFKKALKTRSGTDYEYDETKNTRSDITAQNLAYSQAAIRQQYMEQMNNESSSYDTTAPPTEPEVLKSASVETPKAALQQRIYGRVLVKILVGIDGMPKSAEIVRGIGGGCDEVAKEAAMKFVFKPGTVKGKPVESTITIPFSFR